MGSVVNDLWVGAITGEAAVGAAYLALALNHLAAADFANQVIRFWRIVEDHAAHTLGVLVTSITGGYQQVISL